MRTSFRVPTTTRIGADGAHASDENLTFALKTEAQYHVLTVKSFLSEQDTTVFLGSVQAALALLLLERGIAAEASLRPQSIQYQSDPIATAENLSRSLGTKIDGPVDGLIDGSEAAVYLSEKSLRVITFGQPSVYVTTPATQALQVLVAGPRLPGANP